MKSVMLVLFCCLLLLPTGSLAASVESYTDRPGSDYKNFELPQPDFKLCQDTCLNDPKCKAWTYVRPNITGPKAHCWLKDAVPKAVSSPDCISGTRTGTSAVGVKPETGKADLPFYIDCSRLERSKQPLCNAYIANTRDKVYPILKEFARISPADCPAAYCCDAIYYTIIPGDAVYTSSGARAGGLTSGNRITYAEAFSGLTDVDNYDVHELFHAYSYCTGALDEHVFHGPIQHLVFTRLGRSLKGAQHTAEDRDTAVKWKNNYLERLKAMSGPDLDYGCTLILSFEMTVAYFDLGEDAIGQIYRLSMGNPNPASAPKQRLAEVWGNERARKVKVILEALRKNYNYSFNDLPSICGY